MLLLSLSLQAYVKKWRENRTNTSSRFCKTIFLRKRCSGPSRMCEVAFEEQASEFINIIHCQSHTTFVNTSPIQSANLDGADRNEVLSVFWNTTWRYYFNHELVYIYVFHIKHTPAKFRLRSENCSVVTIVNTAAKQCENSLKQWIVNFTLIQSVM